MTLLRQVGMTPQELDELVDNRRWSQWCVAAPVLAQFGSLRTVRELRGEAEDRALGALLSLAAADGYDDQAAAVAVLHQLEGSVRTIARHFWHLAGADVEGIVVGAMWEQVRSYDLHPGRRHHASVIHHETRKAVRATLMPDTSRTRGRRVVLLSPQSWLFEALAGHDELTSSGLEAFDSRDQLRIFFSWAIDHGVVGGGDVELLVALVDLDRRNPEIPRWLRGACSMTAVERVASERGVSSKTVFRARDRVLSKLREAAPTFLDEVA